MAMCKSSIPNCFDKYPNVNPYTIPMIALIISLLVKLFIQPSYMAYPIVQGSCHKGGNPVRHSEIVLGTIKGNKTVKQTVRDSVTIRGQWGGT